MAVQVHVALSSIVSGSGNIAGRKDRKMKIIFFCRLNFLI